MEVTEVIVHTLLDDLSDIKKNYRIGDDIFKNGVDFCTRLSTGESRIKVWVDIYGETYKPSRDSGRFMKLKWVEDILHRLYTSNHFQHVDDRIQILNRMKLIALDEDASHKANIDAAKVFLDSTAMPEKLNVDVTFDIDDKAKVAFDNMINAISMVANGKVDGILSADGEVIDVKLVH